ncbi:retropepsin-like domain-containing protein [Synechocystis sp. B12]|nr:retropepsin-like domain-containing protein [Synechocystis sp. B12]
MSTPQQWYRQNRKCLKNYRGQWIAYDANGIIAHHVDYSRLITAIPSNAQDYLIERIDETEFVEPLKFYPVRFNAVKNHEWQPKYPIIFSFEKTRNLNILIDSGADISLIPYQLGTDLGYHKLPEEINNKGESVGGIVEYLLRNIEMEIDQNRFSAPVAWLQTIDCNEILIGREVVFDLFDIEFKQAEEVIIFKWRN